MRAIRLLGLFIILLLSVLSCTGDLFWADNSRMQLKRNEKIDTITVAHWNIGHFSLGTMSSSSIAAEHVLSKAKDYRSFLDTLHADIIGICEYNPVFSLSGDNTRELLFAGYDYWCIGSQYSYNCNAAFSTFTIKSGTIKFFPKSVQSRYYLECDFYLNGEVVKFIETHLDWNQGEDGADCRKEQILVLADSYSRNKFVIICGDFNVSQTSEYEPFEKKGYSMANSGALGLFNTYPAENPHNAIDNIIVKGFTIDSAETVNDKELSDHSLLKVRLVMN